MGARMEAAERSPVISQESVIADPGARDEAPATAVGEASYHLLTEAGEKWAPSHARRAVITDGVAIGNSSTVADVVQFPTNDTVGVSPKNNPRATRVCRLPHTYSLGDLPHVFGGAMRPVHSRPQITNEPAGYDRAAKRHPLVPPGPASVWRVSARFSLHHEQAARLNGQYVENQSLARNLLVDARTVSRLLAATGAR